jgi:hypothetical protein
MSDTTTPTETDEPQGMSERTARVLLTGVLLLTIWGVVAALPETAYVVVGIASTLGWQRCRAWREAREEAGEQDNEQPVDVVAHLRALGAGGGHVLLTRLQSAAGLPDTKAVRALLDAAGIRVRTGVRAGGKNGPGVHQDDIPAPPPADDAAPSGRCLCSSGANANTNNGPSVERREWGVTITDPTDQNRQHQVPRTH